MILSKGFGLSYFSINVRAAQQTQPEANGYSCAQSNYLNDRVEREKWLQHDLFVKAGRPFIRKT